MLNKSKLLTVLESLQGLWLLGDKAAELANPAISIVNEALENHGSLTECGCEPIGVTSGCASHPGFFTVVFRSSSAIPDGINLYTEQQCKAPVDGGNAFNAAINFAIEQGADAADFLKAWREGDTSEWPEFEATKGMAPQEAVNE